MTGPGQPHDMDAIDAMGAETAARSEEGAANIGDALRKLAGSSDGRSAAFTQGVAAGRVAA